MTSPDLSQRNISRLSKLLKALNKNGGGNGFLPHGFRPEEEPENPTPEHIPVVEFWEGDLLLGYICYDVGFENFVYQHHDSEVNES